MTRTRLLAAAGAIAAVLIVAYARLAPPIITDSDFAVGEVYVELATRGQLLLGPYSRFGWHHPGPLFFYLVAPFYALAGHQAAAMYAVALAINLASIAVIAWIIARESSRSAAACVVAAVLLLAWRADRFLGSPWTGHIAILPALAFLVAAAAVAAGRLRLIPLAVVFGSFAVQTHVGFAPTVIVIAAVAVVVAMRGRQGDPSEPRRVRVLVTGALTLAVLWAPTIVDTFTNDGGNAAALWRFFVSDADPGHPLRDALIAGSYGLAGAVRPDFELPWGGGVDLTPSFPYILGMVATIGLLIASASYHLAAGRRFDGALALVAVAATVIGVWGLMRIRGEILRYDLFRLAAIGVLDYGLLAGAAVRTFPQRLPTPLSVPLLAALVIGVLHLQSLTAYERRQSRHAMVEAYDAIRQYVDAQALSRPLIRIGNDRWGDAAGVLLRLLHDRTPVAVRDESVPMFTPHFAATGDEDALITLADLELHRELRERADNVILLQAFPLYVDVSRK